MWKSPMSKTCQVEKHSCSLLPCRQSRSFPGRELHDVSLQVARAMVSDERRQRLRGHIFSKHVWYIIYIHHRGPWWWKFYHSSQEPLDISAPWLRRECRCCHWSHVRNLLQVFKPGDVNNLPVKSKLWPTDGTILSVLPLFSETNWCDPHLSPATATTASHAHGFGCFDLRPWIPRSPRSPSEAKSQDSWFQKNGWFRVPTKSQFPHQPCPSMKILRSIPCKKQKKSHENVHFKHTGTIIMATLFPPPGYLQTLGVPSVSAYLTITGSLKPWGMLPSRLSLIHFAWRPQPVTGTTGDSGWKMMIFPKNKEGNG